jgi:hypothetical protein
LTSVGAGLPARAFPFCGPFASPSRLRQPLLHGDSPFAKVRKAAHF